MNAQRNGVYGKRQNALRGERTGMDIANMVYESLPIWPDADLPTMNSLDGGQYCPRHGTSLH